LAFQVDFDSEITGARRTLERIPENDPQWKPHEKSMAIGRLALHTERLPEFCTRILTTPELTMETGNFRSRGASMSTRLVWLLTAPCFSTISSSTAPNSESIFAC